MAMRAIEVTVKGRTALLMHAFPMVEVKAIEKKTVAEQAELAAYRDPDTKGLYLPGVNMQRSLIAGATYSKGKGRATLQKPVAACVMVNPERLALGVDDYVIDTRPVVIPSTRGRVLRHRPRLDEWSVSFELEFDDELVTEAQMRTVLDDSGLRVGIGDFRPECKGPFGRFYVTAWGGLSE